MDFVLPSDETMELMREEFSKLKKDSFARAFALANNNCEDNIENGVNFKGASANKPDRMSLSDENRISNGVNAPEDALNQDGENPLEYIPNDRSGERCVSEAICVLLLLYFVKHLGYNISYGTQIFNTQRGMESIRPDESHFRQLNNLDRSRR